MASSTGLSEKTGVHIPPLGRLFNEMHTYQPARQQDENQAYHISVWFEDGVFTSGIEALQGILNTSVSPTAKARRIVPPSDQLGLLTTLIAHPDLTTSLPNIRANNRGAQTAYHYFHDFLRIVAPADRKLDEAWAFKRARAQTTKRVRKGRGNARSGKKDDDEEDTMESPYATTESLFVQTDDLWDVVGWAFTCSVEHKRRWEWYLLLLKVFLDAFESDWRENVEKTPEKALIMKFLPSGNGSGPRKVFKAIFSNGTDTSLPFKEIWQDELDRQKFHNSNEDGTTKKAALFDKLLKKQLDEELEREAKQIAEAEAKLGEQTIKKTKGKKKVEKLHTSVAVRWGGMDALALRMRFFNLLCSVCYTGQFASLQEMLQQYQELISGFQASEFLLFLGGTVDKNPSFHKMILEFVIEKWLPSTAPVFTNILAVPPRITKKRSMRDLEAEEVVVIGREKKKGRGSLPGPGELSEIRPIPKQKLDKDINTDYGHLTRKKFIYCYAPLAASTDRCSDNMRLAMVIEIMARLLLVDGDLEYGEDLEDAIKQGIEVREGKVQQGMNNKRRKVVDEVEEIEHLQRMQVAHKCLLHVLHVARTKKTKDESETPPASQGGKLPRGCIIIEKA